MGKVDGRQRSLVHDHFSLPFPNVDLLVSRPLAGGFIGNR